MYMYTVQINMAYNHHHNTMIVGKAAAMVEMDREDPRVKEVLPQTPLPTPPSYYHD